MKSQINRGERDAFRAGARFNTTFPIELKLFAESEESKMSSTNVFVEEGQ